MIRVLNLVQQSFVPLRCKTRTSQGDFPIPLVGTSGPRTSGFQAQTTRQWWRGSTGHGSGGWLCKRHVMSQVPAWFFPTVARMSNNSWGRRKGILVFFKPGMLSTSGKLNRLGFYKQHNSFLLKLTQEKNTKEHQNHTICFFRPAGHMEHQMLPDCIGTNLWPMYGVPALGFGDFSQKSQVKKEQRQPWGLRPPCLQQMPLQGLQQLPQRFGQNQSYLGLWPKDSIRDSWSESHNAKSMIVHSKFLR